MKQRVAEKQRERVINQDSENETINNKVEKNKNSPSGPNHFSTK